MKNIAIIGGGASGLIAAWHAADKNKVVLFEKQKKMLEQEGVVFCNQQQIDLGKFLWDPGI